MLTYILNHSKASQARRVSARLLISIAGSNCVFLFPWLQLQLLHLLALLLLLLLLMPSPFSCNLKPKPGGDYFIFTFGSKASHGWLSLFLWLRRHVCAVWLASRPIISQFSWLKTNAMFWRNIRLLNFPMFSRVDNSLCSGGGFWTEENPSPFQKNIFLSFLHRRMSFSFKPGKQKQREKSKKKTRNFGKYIIYAFSLSAAC